MNRILVLADPSSSARSVRDALSGHAEDEDVEAFVVMLWLPRRTLRRNAPRRFWRRANARLDEFLRVLDEARILADGIVTCGHPQAVVEAWLRSLRPRTILVSCDGVARRWIECVEDALDQHARREIRGPAVSWVSRTQHG